ncbi:MAG: SagB/ThcOx family dehydrogenase [Thermodesulfobacteriota bacterium]
MDDLKKSLGYQYLQDTKFDRQTIGRKVRLDIAPAPPSKQYGDAEKVKLPTDWDMDRELRQTLQYRRSWRRFGESPLSMKDISMLLWASQGITGRAGNFFLRAAPSAGALYPVETYLSVQNVETIDAGLFHFQPAEFSLDKLSGDFFGNKIAEAALGQSFLEKAGVVFIWSAILRKNFSKYGHRGMRYILMDAGHISQNLLLAAEALELGACPVAAFYDDELNALLGLDGSEESVIYLAAVGTKE